jgi:hypothetical protein
MTEPRFAGPLSPRLRTLFWNLLRQTIPQICGNRRHRLQGGAAIWTSGGGSYEHICTRRHGECGADTRLRVRFSGRLGGHVLPAHYSASIPTPTPNLFFGQALRAIRILERTFSGFLLISWSHILITVHPCIRRRRLTRLSLCMFSLIFGSQYFRSILCAQFLNRYPCQKPPSTNIATLRLTKTMSGEPSRLFP